MFSLIGMIRVCLACTILRPFLEIHPEMFIYNLKYMGLGMLCIIIVMAVIIGVVLVLNRITAISARKKAEKDAADNNQ